MHISYVTWMRDVISDSAGNISSYIAEVLPYTTFQQTTLNYQLIIASKTDFDEGGERISRCFA